MTETSKEDLKQKLVDAIRDLIYTLSENKEPNKNTSYGNQDEKRIMDNGIEIAGVMAAISVCNDLHHEGVEQLMVEFVNGLVSAATKQSSVTAIPGVGYSAFCNTCKKCIAIGTQPYIDSVIGSHVAYYPTHSVARRNPPKPPEPEDTR